MKRFREDTIQKLLPKKSSVLGYLRASKVTYREMFQAENQLGYCSKGIGAYKVTIANDAPNQAVKDAVLLHECGHLFYHHVDRNLKEDVPMIEDICKANGKTLNCLQYYGGLANFINVAEDCQINECILSVEDIQALNDIGFKPCTPSAYGFGDIVMEDGFLTDMGYQMCYEPLIKAIPDDFENQMDEMAKALQDMLQDMPEGLGGGEGLSDEAKNEARKNPYKSGNSQAASGKANGSEVGTETVGEIMQRGETAKDKGEIGDQSSRQGGNGQGIGHSDGNTVVKEGTADKEIQKMLKGIIGTNIEARLDSSYYQMRGLRRNPDGLLYSKVRTRREDKPVKLGILVDVSGSMRAEAVAKAVVSVRDIAKRLKKGSKIVFWDTHYCGETDLREIPAKADEIKVPSGGGTDLGPGLMELVKEKDFTDIVLYSDFQDSGLDHYASQIPGNIKLYGIQYGGNYDEKTKLPTEYGTAEFCKRLKKCIHIIPKSPY